MGENGRSVNNNVTIDVRAERLNALANAQPPTLSHTARLSNSSRATRASR